MIDIIVDTLLDLIKVMPFLFSAFLIIEYMEHKMNHGNGNTLKKAGKFGPFIGSLLGCVPQCGFSVLATNLYVTRIITLGTLISIYLSTSDEMILIMLAEKESILSVLFIILIKVTIGMFFGFIIDLFIKKDYKENYEICTHDHCDCEHHPFKSALIHTLKISLFILVITFILNILFDYVGENEIKNIFNHNNILTPFISGLIGLIPNCGASVILTELYVKGVLSLSQSISGLLTNSGIALLILFKTNSNFKENMKIIGILYSIGVLSGLILELVL